MHSRQLATTMIVDRLRAEHERLAAAERQLTAIRQETRQSLAAVDPSNEGEGWGLRAELATVDHLLRKTRQARGFVGQALRRTVAMTLYREAARLLCQAATDDPLRWSGRADRRHAMMHQPTMPLRQLAAVKMVHAAILEAEDLGEETRSSPLAVEEIGPPTFSSSDGLAEGRESVLGVLSR